jgi:5-hydroxyisourate hydrolase
VAADLSVSAGGSWAPVESGVTDADGRLRYAAETVTGIYRVTFGTGVYFAAQGTRTFYPEVVVTFAVAAGEHYHVPLLLSPFAYSTYRGR